MLKLNVRALPTAALLGSLSVGGLLADSSLAQDVLSFTRQDTSINEVAAGPNDAATGDFNGDGKVDLAFTSDAFPTLHVRLGNGDGTFQVAPTPPSQQQDARSVVVADFNGDGRQDLAVANFASNVVMIRLGNGDGTFQAVLDINTDGAPASIAAGDFNGDAAQDLAVSSISNGDSDVRIYLGAGDGAFSPGQEIVEGTLLPVTTGDFNGDGVPDLAALDFIFEHHRAIILLGQGDGSFELVAQASDVGPDASSLTVGDFDADGRQDVATADGNNDVLSVLIGNGDGTFAAAVHYPPAPPRGPGLLVQPLAIEVGDFNGDGHQDLTTANRRPADPPVDGSVSVLLGRGDGTLEPARQFATSEGTQVLDVADFNGDGRPDIATFGDSDNPTDAMTILLNTTPVAETRVTIDIRPGSSANRINPGSNGKIRVAVLTRDGFDATEVDSTTVRFGRTGNEAAPAAFALKDADGDGNTDLVLRFRTQQTGIACGDTSASLTGRTFAGQQINGSDSIRTVGCR